MSDKLVKCKYSHCNHSSKEVPIEEAISVGKNSYYHKDCYKQNEEIKQIIEIFKDKIDPMVVISQLRTVINNIIFNKCIDSEYLLFALNYAIANKINLKHAMGLHYIIGYRNIQEAYLKDKNKNKLEQTNKIEIIETEDLPFYFNPTKQKGFDDIIKE
jgi:hypothetical protein